MTRERHGAECKICKIPFNVFRWKPKIPGGEGRYKKTEICPNCSKEKNVCQTCLLDLQHGLPVQVRDSLYRGTTAALASAGSVPQSIVNLDYQTALKKMRGEEITEMPASTELNDSTKNAISILANHSHPYYERNKAKICSFWVKGECTRGDECPFRHEMPKTGPLSVQKFKDRYYGMNDPVAQKMLSRLRGKNNEEADNTSSSSSSSSSSTSGGSSTTGRAVTSLWLTDVQSLTKERLAQYFSSHGGPVREVRVIEGGKKRCAIVSFFERSHADNALQQVSKAQQKGVHFGSSKGPLDETGTAVIDGVSVGVRWSRAPTGSPLTNTNNTGNVGGGGGVRVLPRNEDGDVLVGAV